MDRSDIQIQETTKADREDVLFVEKAAFETDEEAQLVAELLDDASAQPIISLLARIDNKPIGHILFTKARIEGYQKSEHVALLAPLAVIPEYQGKGIGGLLIKEGLHLLKEQGMEMVFVLGSPDYYRKHGFVPDAGSFGYDPPFPIPRRNAEAWMVQALTLQGLSKSVGKFVPADSLNKQKYWEE